MTGRPCNLTARWTGSPPITGEWLKAPKGRTAYEITAVRRIDPRRNAKRYSLVLTVLRHLPSEIPEGATVHEWSWDSRARRQRR